MQLNIQHHLMFKLHPRVQVFLQVLPSPGVEHYTRVVLEDRLHPDRDLQGKYDKEICAYA